MLDGSKLNKKNVCMLVSVQKPFHVNIFHRQAMSLAKNGYSVTILAQSDKKETMRSIRIFGIGKAKNRLHRILRTWKLFVRAFKEKADIYHFFNPELLLWGIILKLVTGKPVIYGAHEHFPDAILIKNWVPPIFRKFIAKAIDIYERFFSKFVDCIIVTDYEIRKRFDKINKKVILLFNFPKLEYFKFSKKEQKRVKQKLIIHAGSISKERGGDMMIEMIKRVKMKIPEIKLILIGKFDSDPYNFWFKNRIRELSLQDTISILGPVPYEKITNYIRKAFIGLSLLQPVSKFKKNIPQKIFEYMACGIPVVASDLPSTSSFINESKCGILVNPTNPDEIADAIIYLFQHSDEARKMGENGRKVIFEKYNWELEEKKLLALYNTLVN